jgi:hypothetical protein
MTALINETRDRISFAVEGVALGAEELIEEARDRAMVVIPALACMLVIALIVLSGLGSGSSRSDATTSPPPEPTTPTLIKERGFSLSLPAGWTRTDAPDGAIFSATSADGIAQSTLWAERKPDLSFDSYVANSLHGLQTLGTGARVSDRLEGHTLETSSAELQAQVPLDGMAPGPYRVFLRAAGPYRYYFAISVAPGAPPRVLADAELLGTSMRPEVPAVSSHAGD